MLRTVYRPLTVDQKNRGVIYSSALIRKGFCETEQSEIHEVMNNDPKKYEIIHNLRDVSFFRNIARESGWSVTNIVRQ